MKTGPIRPNITFFSLPKMLTRALFVSVTLGTLAWFWTEILGFEHSTIFGVLGGVLWFTLACWNWWSWRTRQKSRQWHRWLAGFVYVLYVGGYFLLAGVSFWYKTIARPWNLVVVAMLSTLFVFLLVLPVANWKLARKLYGFHAIIDGKIAALGGIGLMIAVGAIIYWLQKMLAHGSWMILVAILGPIVGFGFIQHQSFEVWQTRPWAKEEE